MCILGSKVLIYIGPLLIIAFSITALHFTIHYGEESVQQILNYQMTDTKYGCTLQIEYQTDIYYQTFEGEYREYYDTMGECQESLVDWLNGTLIYLCRPPFLWENQGITERNISVDDCFLSQTELVAIVLAFVIICMYLLVRTNECYPDHDLTSVAPSNQA